METSLDPRETWFIDLIQRLTGETSPRDEEAILWRDLEENAEEIRAALGYDGIASPLKSYEEATINHWLDYIGILQNDMFFRVAHLAPSVQRLTFNEGNFPEVRLSQGIAVGTWGSDLLYEVTVDGDPGYSLDLTITPPDGMRVTELGSNASNAEDAALVLTSPPQLTVPHERTRMADYTFRVSLFDGSELEARAQTGENFLLTIEHGSVQNGLPGAGQSVAVNFNL